MGLVKEKEKEKFPPSEGIGQVEFFFRRSGDMKNFHLSKLFETYHHLSLKPPKVISQDIGA